MQKISKLSESTENLIAAKPEHQVMLDELNSIQKNISQSLEFLEMTRVKFKLKKANRIQPRRRSSVPIPRTSGNEEKTMEEALSQRLQHSVESNEIRLPPLSKVKSNVTV